jgi:multicomponent Na+:H+ antiporter subunit E
MNLAFLTIVLALGWCAATASFSLLNLLFGAALAGVALYLVRDRVGGTGFWVRGIRVSALVWLFIKELMLSAFRVGLLVASPNMKQQLRPEIIPYPLNVKSDAEITLLANLITLTPGTLSVDVSEDRATLYVHALRVTDRDALIKEIRTGFETAVARAFR